MTRFRLVAAVLCALLFFTWGCTGVQSGKNAWKSTRTVYNRHVNKPAKLTLDDANPLKPYQTTLIEAVTEVDFELEELLRAMDDSDRSPDDEWSRGLMKRFPWVSGTFMTDGRGRLMSRISSSNQPLPDLTPLLETDPKQRPSDLRAMVVPGANGPEIFLAKPVYLHADLRVIIACYFDMRSLLAHYGKPESFMVISGDNLLWPGVYDFSETPLNGRDWTKLPLNRVDGTLRNDRGEFYWLASFFANIQFVYATPVKGDFSVNPRQTAVLSSAKFAGAGN